MEREILTRPCSQDELQNWKNFLNQQFGYNDKQSYAIDFAPLFQQNALNRSRLVWEGSKIVSSATLYPVTAVSPWRTLNLGIIGAVATDEGYRGQGLSKVVINDLEKIAAQEGLEGLILWSDQVEFYKKIGFVEAGKQKIYLDLSELAAPNELAEGNPTYGWDWKQVRALYEQHPMRLERSDDYWRSLEQIKSCVRVQWMDNQGNVLAYLGFDRGRDLHGIIHEWGGERNALHSLLWTLIQNRPQLMWLTHPKLPDLIRDFLPTDAQTTVSHLCLFKAILPTIQLHDLDDVWFWGLDSL